MKPALHDPGLMPHDVDNTNTNGQIDMEHYFEDMDGHPGTASPDVIMSGIDEDNEIDEAPVARTVTFSPSRSASPPSPDVNLSERHNHGDHTIKLNMRGTNTPVSGPSLSSADSVSPGDNGLYGTSDDSPWISIGGGDLESHSPIEGTESTSDSVWNGTIDPTLLGGGSLAGSHPPSPSPSPPPSPLAVAVHPEVPPAETSPPPLRASPQPPLNNEPRRNLSRRIPRRRNLDGMVPIDDLDLSAESSQSDDSERNEDSQAKGDGHVSSRRLDNSASSRKPARSGLTVHTQRELVPTSSSRDNTESTSRRRTTVETIQTRPERPKPQTYPQTTELAFCHQCRNATLLDKMKCSTVRPDGTLCTLKFCVRCIENRYVNYLLCYVLTSFKFHALKVPGHHFRI
jgi:hypothetical protein